MTETTSLLHKTIMSQDAPYPQILDKLVRCLEYKPGWLFYLDHIDRGQGSHGLTLDIIPKTTDSYNHDKTNYRVHHYFIVPAAAYDERSWRRWLFERILDVEKHEAMEFFVVDGCRPLAPAHGPGSDPYFVFEYVEDELRRTNYLGEVSD